MSRSPASWLRLDVRGLGHPIRRRLPGTALGRMIRDTARQEWPLLVTNLASSLILGACEGLTLAVVYKASELLSGRHPVALPSRPLFQPAGAVQDWLSGLPVSQQFALFLSVAILLQLLMSLARYVNGVSAGWLGASCQRRIAPEIHRYLLSLSFGYASRYSIGDLVNRAALAPQIVQIQLEECGQILSNLILIMVYVGGLLVLAPVLSIVALFMAVIFALVQQRLRPRIRASSLELAAVRTQVSAGLTEDMQLLRLLHSTAGIDAAQRRLEAKTARLEGRMRSLTQVVQLLEPVNDLLPVLAAACIGLISWQVFHGDGGRLVPNLITFVLVLQRLNLRLLRLGTSFTRLNEHLGSIQQVEDLLDPIDKQFRRQGGLPFHGLRQGIRFAGVSLTYPDNHHPSLVDVDLEIPVGHNVALVGPSGGGKSSLVNLLVGLHSPSRGCVLIDGLDLERIDLNSWQSRLGIVSQEVLLLNGSVADNIAYGRPDASREQIIEAAETADAAGFIAQLPNGYDTWIGEGGFRLSGGQRQRLSLARALLRNPEILILDEATSALDTPGERRIQRALRRFSRGRTVLTVAHRLSSVLHADQILVLEAGRIVERGSHRALLDRGGAYAALWNAQAGDD